MDDIRAGLQHANGLAGRHDKLIVHLQQAKLAGLG
jgi:hypothetical protein